MKTARTLLAQPYPPQLAMASGDLVAEALHLRSQALKDGSEVPHAPVESSFGHPILGVTWQHPVLQANAGSGSEAVFVVRGNGAPAGLDPRAHFDWARVQAHAAADLLPISLLKCGEPFTMS